MPLPDLSRVRAALTLRGHVHCIVEALERGHCPSTSQDPADHYWLTVRGWGWVWTFWTTDPARAGQWPSEGELAVLTGDLETNGCESLTIRKPAFEVVAEARR